MGHQTSQLPHLGGPSPPNHGPVGFESRSGHRGVGSGGDGNLFELSTALTAVMYSHGMPLACSGLVAVVVVGGQCSGADDERAQRERRHGNGPIGDMMR